VLIAAGAVDVGTADEIQHDLHLARTMRQPGPLSQTSPGPGGVWPATQWRLERFMRFLQPPRTATGAFPVSRLDVGYHQPWRVVPVGQVLQIRDDHAGGELYVLAYAQTAGGARFTVTGWTEGPSGLRGPGPSGESGPCRSCGYATAAAAGTPRAPTATARPGTPARSSCTRRSCPRWTPAPPGSSWSPPGNRPRSEPGSRSAGSDIRHPQAVESLLPVAQRRRPFPGRRCLDRSYVIRGI
jgi:hypothetical protein